MLELIKQGVYTETINSRYIHLVSEPESSLYFFNVNLLVENRSQISKPVDKVNRKYEKKF